MFKKAVKVSAQNQLSGKDRKGIKNKLATQLDDQSLEALFTKNDKIVCNKISGSKMLIYMGEDYPLLVDGTGKEDFFPSVYVCTAYQPLTRSIVINEGVQTFIFNGANLMWPGVYSFEGLGNFKKDEVVSIRNLKGEVIAVGALGCSLDQLKQSPDGSGIAAYILHFKGDRLWDMGTKQYPDVILKAKAKEVQVKKQEVKPEVKQQPKKEEKKEAKEVKQDSESEQEQKPKGKGKQKKQQAKKDKKKEKKEQKKNESEEQQEQKPQPKGKKNKEKAVQSKAPVKNQPQPVSDDEDLDFGGFVHTTKKQKPQFQMQKKKVAVKFSDDEDDKKGKKKGQKKGGKKQQQQQEQVVHKEPPKKQQKHQEQQEQAEQQDNRKPKGKKGKGKKQQQPSDDQQQKPEPKKQANKKKQGKKQYKKEQSEEQNDEQEEKPEKEVQEKEEKEDKSAISSQLMDQHFKEAFLNVLKLTKVEAQLPIDSGRFFSDYMVLARSEGVKLQIKDSSYKKLGKFYEQMAKQKLIQFKPAKEKKGQQGSTITKIFWQNEELKNYFPSVKRLREKEVEEKEQVYSKQKLKLSKTVQVDFVYKLSDDLKQILYKKVVNYMPTVQQEQAMSKQQDVSKKEIFLTDKQLKQKIEKYINDIVIKDSKQAKQSKQEKEGKQGKDGKQKKVEKLITLSYKDNKFIYDLLKSEIEQYEENLQKQEIMAAHNSDDQDKKQDKKAGKKDKHKKNLFRIQRGYLVNKIMKLAHTYYNISDKQTGLSKFKQGNFKGIQLIADKVVNKNVTKIIGLQNFIPSTIHEDEVVKQIHGFTNTLQLKFASSANVQNLPGKNAGKQIVIQGNFVDELQSLLMSQYGIKKEYITIQNKLGKKKKN